MTRETPPDDMSQSGKDLWAKLFPEVSERGWTEARYLLLSIVCDQWNVYEACREDICEHGINVQQGQRTVQNPAIGTQKIAVNNMNTSLKSLGLDDPKAVTAPKTNIFKAFKRAKTEESETSSGQIHQD